MDNLVASEFHLMRVLLSFARRVQRPYMLGMYTVGFPIARFVHLCRIREVSVMIIGKAMALEHMRMPAIRGEGAICLSASQSGPEVCGNALLLS